jgi:hypothetical protein
VVGGLLSHKVLLLGLRLIGALPLPVGSLVLFPVALTPIRTCHRGDSSNLINAISLEEELGRAQSNATHTKAIRSRLDTEQRPRSKVVIYFS